MSEGDERETGVKSMRVTEDVKGRNREKCYECQQDAKDKNAIVYCVQCNWG